MKEALGVISLNVELRPKFIDIEELEVAILEGPGVRLRSDVGRVDEYSLVEDTFKGADDVVEIAFEPVVSIGISICEVGANRIVEINISSSVED